MIDPNYTSEDVKLYLLQPLGLKHNSKPLTYNNLLSVKHEIWVQTTDAQQFTFCQTFGVGFPF